MSEQRKTDILIDAGLAIDGHGFAETFGNVEDADGWNGLAYVSAVLLDNVGEHDLAGEYRAHVSRDHQSVVWIRIDSDGNKTLHRTAPGHDSEAEQILLSEWEHAAQA